MGEKRSMSLLQKLILAGVIVCMSGVAIGWGILPTVVRNKLTQSKSLIPGTDSRKIWEKLPFPMVFKVTIFNISNPESVDNGGVPVLNEIGPYYFEEWKEKVEIEDNSTSDTVKFRMKDTFIFDTAKTLPLTGNEIVYVPHLAMMGAVLTAEREKPAFLKMVAKALPSVFNQPSSVLLRTTVMDFLFNGNVINCTGTEFPAKAMCGILKKSGAFLEREPNIFLFSVFGKKNGTKSDGEFTVQRGSNDAQVVGQMVTYNGLPEQKTWTGLPCNSINGTDGTIFPPFIEQQPILTFAPDLCRSLSTNFIGLSKYKAFPTYHFTSDFGDMSKPDQQCFCPAPDKCLKKGVMDLFKCQGAPIIASLPHFLGADPQYINSVRGLSPDEEKHSISVLIEPFTGSPMKVRKRIQFSYPLHSVNNIELTSNLTEAVVPFIWLEEGMDLSDVILAELDDKLFKILRGIDIMKWVTTATGAGISLFGVALNFFNPFSKSETITQPTANKIFSVHS